MVFLSTVFLSISASALNVIDTGTYNDHTYYLLDKSTWIEAEKKAVELGGHLVTINDANENQWVYKKWYELNHRWLWIGINDAKANGHWSWLNGDPVTYTNWSSGEPNYMGIEHYGSIWGDGTWNNAVGNISTGTAGDGTQRIMCGVIEINSKAHQTKAVGQNMGRKTQ